MILIRPIVCLWICLFFAGCTTDSTQAPELPPDYEIQNLLDAPLYHVLIDGVTLSMGAGYKQGVIGERLKATAQLADWSGTPLDASIEIDRMWVVSGQSYSASERNPEVWHATEQSIWITHETSFLFSPGTRIVIVLDVRGKNGQIRRVRSNSIPVEGGIED